MGITGQNSQQKSQVDEGFVQFSQQLAAAATNIEDPWEQLIALGRAYVYVTFGLQHLV